MNLQYRPAFLHLNRDYNLQTLWADLSSGLTVGVIALPLAIGFGIASGCTPAQGLWSAIVGGLAVSLLGGSRFQIGGPTGAFVPILAGVVALHGYAGLAIATILAGALMVLAGLFRLGAFLRYIPYPVVAGFTSGIAVIIFLGQLPEFLGLQMERPGHAPELIRELITHLSSVSWQTAAVGITGLLVVFGFPRISRKVPAAIVAVVATSVLVKLLDWPVATIGTRFGGLPSELPNLGWPSISLEAIRTLIGPAFTIAALGSIESLLSATVADGMTDSRHDSNSELIGQGVANLVTPLFGGFAVTGAIARTAANIRSGARSPLSGVIHAMALLSFILLAAPLASDIPLAGLAAVLMGVAIRMAEWRTFQETWKCSRSEFATLIVTFGLTVVFDLTIGVAAGLAIAVAFFIRRLEDVSHVHLLTEDTDTEHDGALSLRGKTVPEGVVLFRLEGPLFFAVVARLEAALRPYSSRARIVILRMRHVPTMDSSALHALEIAVDKLKRHGIQIILTAVQPQPMKLIRSSGLATTLGEDNFCLHLDDALKRSNALLGTSGPE